MVVTTEYPTARRFEGKVVVVTGAGRGMGRAIAVRLAREGANLIAIDIAANAPTIRYGLSTPDDLAETVRLVRETGAEIIGVQADVRDFDALSAAVQKGLEVFGRLDVVIGNAGINSAAKAWEITAEQWREVIDVSLTGQFHLIKATIPVLLEQKRGGAVVLTSSTGGLRGLPYIAHYNASKHGVVGLAKTLANELARDNIRVNTIHPGPTRTGMITPELGPLLKARPDLEQIYDVALPAPQQGTEPEGVAAAVAYLASDEARHVTGTQFVIDLGNLVR